MHLVKSKYLHNNLHNIISRYSDIRKISSKLKRRKRRKQDWLIANFILRFIFSIPSVYFFHRLNILKFRYIEYSALVEKVFRFNIVFLALKSTSVCLIVSESRHLGSETSPRRFSCTRDLCFRISFLLLRVFAAHNDCISLTSSARNSGDARATRSGDMPVAAQLQI